MIGRLRGLAANLPAYLRVFGWGGLMSFARVRYSQSREPRAVFLRGHAHPVWIRPDSTDVMTLREIFIARDYDFPVHREIRTIIDAGANIGLSSVFFAHKYPRARVVAIEPEAENFALLQRNTRGYATCASSTPAACPIRTRWRASSRAARRSRLPPRRRHRPRHRCPTSRPCSPCRRTFPRSPSC